MTSLSLLCLAFISIPSPSTPPENVRSLLHNRLKHQWTQHRPAVALSFENKECKNLGTLSYHENHLELTADSKDWKGTLQIPYQDLLDGRSLQFSNVSTPLTNSDLQRSTRPNFKSRKKKWLPWALAAIGVGVTATLIHQRNQQIKKINAFNLKF